MMKNIIILFISIPFFLLSQADTLNKLDAKGKKDGRWIAYLDAYLIPTDSSNSFFVAYELYEHGKHLHRFTRDSWRIKDSIVYNSSLPSKGRPMKLNGVFKWYNKKTKLIASEEEYNNGYPVFEKEYHYTKRKDSLVWLTKWVNDFTKTYNNTKGSFYVEEFNNPQETSATPYKRYWYYKKDGKWGQYRIKD